MVDRQLDRGKVILLKKGLNFAVTPTEPPRRRFNYATEMTCKNTIKHRADGLRSEVAKVV